LILDARPRDPDILRTIPLFEVGAGGAPALADAAPERLAEILVMARRHYGRWALRAGDIQSRRWLEKAGNPYLPEMAAVADRLRSPGAYVLNLSFEWSCTTGVAADPTGPGNRMRRTLDWMLAGLGRTVVVARQAGPAGHYFNVTWPGFVGVTTAMAPSRFSAALNQPPMRKHSPLFALDWLINRLDVGRRRTLPPPHLLRRVFDTCLTYAEAREALTRTPLCIPAFFTLSGNGAEEGCVIERTEDACAVRENPACITNHWETLERGGWTRGLDSRGRMAALTACSAAAGEAFAWVVSPVRNADTRVAVVANAASGTLLVQGHETDGPATGVFSL
jgi:hypothetical protein